MPASMDWPAAVSAIAPTAKISNENTRRVRMGSGMRAFGDTKTPQKDAASNGTPRPRTTASSPSPILKPPVGKGAECAELQQEADGEVGGLHARSVRQVTARICEWR